MAFYRMQQGQNEFYFQLADLNSAREEYVFWKDGEVPPIPIRDAVNGITPREAYWDRTGTRQIAGHRADRSFLRDIIVTQGGNNTQYTFVFKKRDTQQLDAEISNIVNLQRKDPLTFNFKFRKTGQGKETIRVVIAMQEVGLPKNVQQSSIPYQSVSQIQKPYIQPEQKPAIMPQSVQLSSKDKPFEQTPITPQKEPETAYIKPTEALQQGFELPKQVPNVQNVVALTEKEQVVYAKACEYPGTLIRSDFVDGFRYTYKKLFNEELSGQRAMDIFDELYIK